jgi:KaiC/GvpD/RAD55 family RecA-like ATPase
LLLREQSGWVLHTILVAAKMIKDGLVQRSPIRIFEKSINGGLKAGEIGLIASPHGIGKTSVLVQIALYKLLQAQKVIHVSFTKHTDYILSWYEAIFDEFIKKKNLENAEDVKNDLVKNRVLMNFNQEGMTDSQILKSLRAMIVDGGFKAESLIIDGFDFSLAKSAQIGAIKEFARETGLSVWYSCSVKDGPNTYDSRKIPLIIQGYLNQVDVVIVLESQSSYIGLSVSKDRDVYNPASQVLKLEPKTLLLLEEV